MHKPILSGQVAPNEDASHAIEAARRLGWLHSAVVLLALVLLSTFACVELMRRRAPSPAEEQPRPQVQDDPRDTGELPTHEAPPPAYGHRVVREAPATASDESETKQLKPPSEVAVGRRGTASDSSR